jgi:K+-transporting ATPase ATPase C chain
LHGRPSATTGSDPNDPANIVFAPYNASNSGGSTRLAADRSALDASQPKLAGRPLLSDMLTASASGLDPNISPADADLRVARVARASGISVADVNTLLGQYITGRSLGIFGEPRVNVVALNLALQDGYPKFSTGARVSASSRVPDQAP